MRNHIRCGGTSMAAIALVLGSAAHAQTTGAETNDAEEASSRPGVAEIIVSAQRRQERQLEVPISLTAVTGELLQNTNVFSVQQLGQLVPSFQYEESLASSGARARIRGIGSPTFVSGVETSVSVVIDGVVTGPSGSGLANLFDVELVEVLRGPQGTLFGKNATAGVVNITSAKPTRDFSAGVSVQTSVGDFGPVKSPWNVRADAFVSGPVSDSTAVRVAAFSDVDLEGMVEDRFRGGSTYDRRQYGGRFTLVHESGPLSIDFTASYVETDDNCCVATFRQVSPGAERLGLVPTLLQNAAAFGVNINPRNRSTFNSAPVTERTHAAHLALAVAYEIGDFTLKSITGYRDWESFATDDSDRTGIDIADATTANVATQLFSQELQLISPKSETFNYVLGLYYYEQNTDDVFAIGGGFFTANPRFRVSTATSDIFVQNIAAFGNATFNITPEFQILAGGRLLRERQRISGFRVGTFYAGNRPPGQAETSDTNWTGRLGVRYMPSYNTNIFATVSRGYKGFGLNNANNGPLFDPTNTASPILRPEIVWNYELGIKSRWLDDKIETNFVLFQQDFTDFQTSSFDGASNTFSLRNAGSIRSRGFEFDATAAPWKGASINMGIAYVDAVFTDFRGAPCTALQTARGVCPVGGQDLTGRPIDGNPEWMLSFVGRQAFPLGSQEGHVQLEVTHKSDIQFNSDLDPLLVQPAYTVINMRMGTSINSNIDLGLFVENLGNTFYTNRISPAPLFPGVTAQYLAPGRTFGGQVRARF